MSTTDNPRSKSGLLGRLDENVVRDGIAAGAVAALASGVPGSMVLPREKRTSRLLVAAAPVHLVLSLGWGVALSAALPRRRTVAAGALAGALIAALDLGLIGRRFERIRSLPVVPQIADHVAFGACVGAVVRHRR
jgi:hypothetical protein